MSHADASDMGTLRGLRLWHWRKVLSYRAVAQRHEAAQRDWDAKHGPKHKSTYNATKARNAHRDANRHLGAVQALNDCFPMGDTAEEDARLADRIKQLTVRREPCAS